MFAGVWLQPARAGPGQTVAGSQHAGRAAQVGVTSGCCTSRCTVPSLKYILLPCPATLGLYPVPRSHSKLVLFNAGM